MNPSARCGRDRSRADNFFPPLRCAARRRDAEKIRGRAPIFILNRDTLPLRHKTRLKPFSTGVNSATTDSRTIIFAPPWCFSPCSPRGRRFGGGINADRLNRGPMASKPRSVRCRARLSSKSSDGRDATHAANTSETARCCGSEAGSRLLRSPQRSRLKP
jgi:hypothetical protein